VDATDGISKEEASYLAGLAWNRKYPGEGCGAHVYAGETESHWLFDALFGFAAKRTGTIHVSKTTGATRFQPR
jgi:hypothetical protein